MGGVEDLLSVFDLLSAHKAKNKNTFVSPHFEFLKSGRGGGRIILFFSTILPSEGLIRAVLHGLLDTGPLSRGARTPHTAHSVLIE